MPTPIQSRFSRFRAALRRVVGYPFVRNVNKVRDGVVRRRCLMVYLSIPFTRSARHSSFLMHQNLGQAKVMASVLGEVGFCVDVADVRSERLPVSAGTYDLIMTHHPSLALIENHLTAKTTVVYLAAGMHHAIHNQLVKARLDALEKRRNFRIPPYAVHDEALTVLTRANAVAGFGNHVTMGSWAPFFQGSLYPFNNSGFDWIRPAEMPASDRACHFLFFGSTDQVRKGLDLLLEVFSRHPDKHLHVAGYYGHEPEFCECYRRELYQTPNIHLHGTVLIGSPVWTSLIRQCAFVILPSCTEGQAGSVIQAMHAGLIPVVTAAVGIDVGPFGIVLPSDPLPTLGDEINRVARMPLSELERLREATLTAARAHYSEVAFLTRWRDIARSISGLGVLGRSQCAETTTEE